MPSKSLQKWLTTRSALLDDIEHAHRSVRGTGPGSRAASQQINQAYAVLLSAQFQGFCRDFHTECIELFLTPVADPDLRIMLQLNMMVSRKIDRGNPNPGNIGSDFNRFGISFWGLLDSHSSATSSQKRDLELLNEWRNAIAHQDFASHMIRNGKVYLPVKQIRTWRRSCESLAKSFEKILGPLITLRTGTTPW